MWDGNVPPARSYYFSHFALFDAARHLPEVRRARSAVFFTHPPKLRRQRARLALLLRHADVVLSMSSLHARGLVRWGVPGRKVEVVIPGADPSQFVGHDRGGGAVGFCSAFYERKAPDTMLDIIRSEPQERFMLLGRSWERWERWSELSELSNLTYWDTDYERYPELYREMDVFVSTSRLEGGPIPLIEAMMSNVVPVTTRTGFAEDVILDGVTGVLVELGADVGSFLAAIKHARSLDVDVRSRVLEFTWANFARRSYEATTG